MTTLAKAKFPGFQDSSGNPTCPQLNPDGTLPVSSQAPGTCFDARGKTDLTETASVPDSVKIATVDITDEKSYKCLEFHLQSNADAVWKIVYTDDATGTPAETILHEVITGPAKSECCALDCVEFNTIGGTGTQRFEVYAELVDFNDADACAIAYIATKELP